MTNDAADQRGRLTLLRAQTVEAIHKPEVSEEYLRQCQENFDNQKRRERQAGDRDMLELIDMIRSELAEASLVAVAPAPSVASSATEISVDGEAYAFAPADALKLTGALWQVLSRREATVELASGQTLVLTARNIDDVMQQLAGVAGDTEGT
jgi:hypothetical protein